VGLSLFVFPVYDIGPRLPGAATGGPIRRKDLRIRCGQQNRSLCALYGLRSNLALASWEPWHYSSQHFDSFLYKEIADCSPLVRNCSCSWRKQYHVPAYNLASTFFKLFVEHPAEMVHDPVWTLRNLRSPTSTKSRGVLPCSLTYLNMVRASSRLICFERSPNRLAFFNRRGAVKSELLQIDCRLCRVVVSALRNTVPASWRPQRAFAVSRVSIRPKVLPVYRETPTVQSRPCRQNLEDQLMAKQTWQTPPSPPGG
jgi:hypothetical protein